MKHIQLHLILRSLASILVLTMFFVTSLSSMSSDDIVTDIILINGYAVLVDIDNKGEVLKKHLDIPNYFRSSRTHESLRRSSLIKAKGLSKSHKLFDSNHFLSFESSTCSIKVDEGSSVFDVLSISDSTHLMRGHSQRNDDNLSPFYKSYAIRRVNYLT